MKLLDLFCGAGGCSVGYARAGFDVVGVDIRPQPRYPFPFRRHDAIDALEILAMGSTLWFDNNTIGLRLSDFDVIHASPPCQDHSPLRSVAGEHGTGWLLDAMLDQLAAQPAVWIVENVGAAHNRADFLLCGEMFGLRTIRHRRFTVDPRLPGLLAIPPHPKHRARTSTKKRRTCWDAGMNISVTGDIGSTIGGLALDIDWMNGNELSQAIPPAYTEYIGAQLLELLAVST